MAGSLLKRQRKAGIRAEDDSLPLHAAGFRASTRWRHFSTAEKIEHLIGLDRCREILELLRHQ
jgi:hypothetical protein